MKDEKQLVVTVPAETHRRLKTLALIRNCTMSDIVRQKVAELTAEVIDLQAPIAYNIDKPGAAEDLAAK